MGNKNSKRFQYDDFLKLIRQSNKQEIASQQDLLHQYYCLIQNHNNKLIDGICFNETCKQKNRRTCFDCINDRIHDTDQGKISLIKNADQSANIINEFKSIINQQMDEFQFQFSFEQLELCDEKDNYFAYIKFQELIKIDEKFEQIQQKKNKLNFKQYLQEQQQNNVGLFQYLQDYQNLIDIIQQQLNGYKQIKNQNEKFHEFQVDRNNIEVMQTVRKKKISIIYAISKTNKFKNEQIQKYQKQYLIKNIGEIINSTDQYNQELKVNNYKLLFKIDPQNAKYYHNKDKMNHIQRIGVFQKQ